MTSVDRCWSEAMLAITCEPLDRVAQVFDRCSRGVVRGTTLAAIGLALTHRRRWDDLGRFAAAATVTPVAVNVIKLAVDRQRPTRARVDPLGTSFPSGHAAYAGATTVALVLLASDSRPPRRRWWMVAATGTVGVAWSRTYLQAHWLTDVAAGALLGSVLSRVTFAVVKRRQAAAVGARSRRRLATAINSGTTQAPLEI